MTLIETYIKGTNVPTEEYVTDLTIIQYAKWLENQATRAYTKNSLYHITRKKRKYYERT